MDKVQKIKEWIKTRKLCTMDEHMKFYCKEAESEYNLLCSIEEVLDSMQKVPVSEDLEDAIGEYCSNPDNFATWIGGKETDDIPLIIKAIKFGANWQKEQMMAKAVDAHCFGIQDDALFSFRLQARKYLVGSKVKVIVIKEDRL